MKLGKRSTPTDAHDVSREEQLLKSTGLFSSFDPARLRELTGRLSRVTYREGERIVEEGDVGDAFYVIGTGAVRISTIDENAQEIVLARLEPGQYFGEQALFDEIPSRRNASATAIADTDVLRLDPSDFHRLLEASGKLEQTLRERGARPLVERGTRQRPPV